MSAVRTRPTAPAAAGQRPTLKFLDQGNLDKVCKQAELLSATCPKSSVYGHAKAFSPLLEKPLEGPVYLAVGFGYKLPALVADDPDPAEKAVPDAPVSRFVLDMKGGKKYGLLVNSEDICGKPQKALAHFVAQNGKVLNLHPLIANSCKKSGSGKKAGGAKHHKGAGK